MGDTGDKLAEARIALQRADMSAEGGVHALEVQAHHLREALRLLLEVLEEDRVSRIAGLIG